MHYVVGRRSGKSFRQFETIFKLLDEKQAMLDQAVEDIRMLGRMGQNVCPVCANYNHGEGDKQKCVGCIMKWDTDNFEWRCRKTMKAYRVENQAAGHGIWRNFDGSLNPVFSKLSDGLAKNLPMPDSDFYRYGGKQWFSATDKPEKLTAWFSLQDVLEMLAMGYEVWEFEITDCRTVSEYEIVFTRDSIVSQKTIDYREIWGGAEG